MDKLIRALVIAAATTIGAAIILQRLDQRAPAGSGESEDDDPNGATPTRAEIDADLIEPDQREAMLAELEAQL